MTQFEQTIKRAVSALRNSSFAVYMPSMEFTQDTLNISLLIRHMSKESILPS